jgi:hypothetical protein
MIKFLSWSPDKSIMRALFKMSILGQIEITRNLQRLTTVGQVPRYVKGLAYERVYQPFERPHDALGSRYRNPLARLAGKILDILRIVPRAFSRIGRIEITVRMKPE